MKIISIIFVLFLGIFMPAEGIVQDCSAEPLCDILYQDSWLLKKENESWIVQNRFEANKTMRLESDTKVQDCVGKLHRLSLEFDNEQVLICSKKVENKTIVVKVIIPCR